MLCTVRTYLPTCSTYTHPYSTPAYKQSNTGRSDVTYFQQKAVSFLGIQKYRLNLMFGFFWGIPAMYAYHKQFSFLLGKLENICQFTELSLLSDL